MFNAVAPFAQFKRLFIKPEEGKKKKENTRKIKTNFHPSVIQDSCSKLQISNKKK